MNSFDALIYNLGNGMYNSYNDINYRKRVLKTTRDQINIIKKINTDFLLIQELTGFTPMNLGIKTNEIFLNSFDQYNMKYFDNVQLLKSIVKHGKIVGSKYDCIFRDNEVSRNEEDYARIKRNLKFLSKYLEYSKAYILNNKSMPEIYLEDYNLSLFNIHLSPFIPNQIKRIKELDKIWKIIKERYETGGHVVLGGDFNFDLTNKNNGGDFPDYAKNRLEKNGWQLIVSEAPTYYANKKKKSTYRHLDGFIVSPNVEVLDIKSYYEFISSDHSPVRIKFKLK